MEGANMDLVHSLTLSHVLLIQPDRMHAWLARLANGPVTANWIVDALSQPGVVTRTSEAVILAICGSVLPLSVVTPCGIPSTDGRDATVSCVVAQVSAGQLH
jgi:hypothetical protein